MMNPDLIDTALNTNGNHVSRSSAANSVMHEELRHHALPASQEAPGNHTIERL
jgi:hypothetical protein